MKIKLKLNIGKRDAHRLKIYQTQQDEILIVGLDVDRSVADEMIARGWAEELSDEPAQKPAKAKAEKVAK